MTGQPAGILCDAIEARSEGKVKSILASTPNSINERDALGFHALHLAADWPQGLRQILAMGGQSLINETDDLGSSALDHAAATSNMESMTLLINAGCLAIDESAIFSRLDPAMTDLAIQVLKARRQYLCVLAQQHLSKEQFAPPPPDKVLDEGTSELFQLLTQSGVVVPRFFAPLKYYYNIRPGEEVTLSSRGSVYHNRFLTASIADRFWKEGFRDIDALDVFGISPFCKHSAAGDFDLVAWFLAKGAKVQAGCPCPGLPPIDTNNRLHKLVPADFTSHYIASGLARRLAVDQQYSEEQRLGKIKTDVEGWQCLSSALESLDRDDCSCLCSIGGCTPLLVALKQRWGGGWQKNEKALRRRRNFLLEFARRRPIEMIRFATFEVFELTHTCCKVSLPYCLVSGAEDEEIEEIQDEEHVLISKFEDVTADLEQSFEQSKTSVTDFIHGHWKDTMLEVLSESEPLDAQTLSDLESIGVEIVDEEKEKVGKRARDNELDKEYGQSFLFSPTPHPLLNYWLHFFDKSAASHCNL